MPSQPPRFADYTAATEYLYALKSAGVKFGVDRMRGLAEALGHPERSYPVVHIAGTNGKGSVSAMVESILRGAGYRTGLYTSPHLVKLGERVQVNRRILSEAEIIRFANELVPVAEKLGTAGPDDYPSFFEFMTAMAFLQFARGRVDAAVIEVGMGGRLDATNVVQPEVTVVTSIGYDHMEQLGDTLEKIATEKAGIVKPARPLVIGRLPTEAEAVIRGIAAERGAPVASVREEFGEDIARYPATNLEGDYQRWNAATATLISRLLRSRLPRLTDDAIAEGLRQVAWPGRWQRTTLGGRTVILDASHNPEGAAVLDMNMRRLVAEFGRKPIVVTGVLGEFRARALLEVIARHAREVHLIPPHQARACSYEELERIGGPDLSGRLKRATIDAVFPDAQTCALGGPDDVVVVTGSIYLLGEILAHIQPGCGAGEQKLQDF
ncbi:MAG TPA: folylpolyglutamate synthase/dihydrofolate synthase family protein [Acidobacteriota bacterium]|nr:folylpolyglutamate synthase/dihydrofolate synthase family protein [Acidobacteriota bacterium]